MNHLIITTKAIILNRLLNSGLVGSDRKVGIIDECGVKATQV